MTAARLALVPIKVMDVEVSRPLADLRGLDGYGGVMALVRAHGVPLGCVEVPVLDSACSATALRRAILAGLSETLLAHLGECGTPRRRDALVGAPLHELVARPPTSYAGPWPSLTVAVCTRDRAADLAQSLDAIVRLDYPGVDILVVDNAPSDDATERLVRGTYPTVRYMREPRPGLDWARCRAVREARGDIVAFTDDDAIVEPDWAHALASAFATEGDDVMAVGGVTVPIELETDAQVHFERYGGFAGGFTRRRMRGDARRRARGVWRYVPMAQHFSGANMAFRRRVFDDIGLFDPALDVGTPTNGGGDQEMFLRVLMEGYAVLYEPRALVRHRHRRGYHQIRRQISGWGTGTYAILTRTALAYPATSWAVGLLALRGVWQQTRRLAASFVRPPGFPRVLFLVELHGSLVGPVRYWRSRRAAAETSRAFALGRADART